MSNRTKAILVILAGLVLVAVGVFASYLLLLRIQADQAPPPVPEDVVEVEIVWADVVFVTRDLFLGDRLVPTDLELTSVPVELVPRTAIADPEDAVGKFIKTDLVQGQMLLSHNLADPTNNNQDLSFILSDDNILMAFPATDLMSTENIPQRGDIVDIFATFSQTVTTAGDVFTDTGEEEETQTRTFTLDALQRVEVTALVVDVIEQEPDENLEPGQTAEGAPTRVTNIRAYLLALDPQDALILKHFKDTGAIFDIVLRAPTSTVQFELTPVTEQFIIEFYGLEILP